MTGMTLGEVRDWALGNGFTEGDDGVLSCPYGAATVSLTLTGRDVVVDIAMGDRHQRIVRAHPKHAHINDCGVIEGIGLSASFLAGYAREGGGRPKPDWMPDAYVEAVGRSDLLAPPAGPAGP